MDMGTNYFLEPWENSTLHTVRHVFLLLLQKLFRLVYYTSYLFYSCIFLHQHVFAQLSFGKTEKGEYFPVWQHLRSDVLFSIFLFCISKGNILCKSESVKIGVGLGRKERGCKMELSCKWTLSGLQKLSLVFNFSRITCIWTLVYIDK